MRLYRILLRMALGAAKADILRMVLGQALVLAALGCTLGLGGGYVAGRWIEALLVGVKPADFPSFLSATLLALAMTISGSFFPMLRATGVSPTTVMRAE
jgi:ABC-type antimicrobial peptide transport system permease subunit